MKEAKTIKYPNCQEDYLWPIGDGRCHGGAYNTEECGWDGGDCIEFNEKYPHCVDDYPGLIGNGNCNGREYNTEECGWDGGDCIEFNEKYPNCTVYPSLLDAPSRIGDGNCNGKEYNTEECGWDGGDCIEFNQKYPNCNVNNPSYIGNGHCSGGVYNTEECGWDEGDCFIAEYPDCHAYPSTWLGDGRCHNGIYNTEECGWDSGDCLIAEYPDCHVDYPSFIGDGECWGGAYNTEECGWDGGDCLVDKTKRIGIILGGVAIVLLSLVLWYKCERREGNHPAREYVNPNPENEPVDIKTLILSSIIHKKVVSSSNKKDGASTNAEDKILPHEAIVTERSVKIQSLRIEYRADHKNQDEEAQQIKFELKDDIMVETLRSIRSIMKSNLTDQNIQDSLYNPKTCPICCEEYEKGDDISWSKNERCVHAYHTDCILLWLMEHSDCPMCRSDYLCLQDE